MKNTTSIKKNHEFKRLYAKGNTQTTPFLAMYLRKNGSKSNELGITVGVKLGNAVVRNKVRRRLKEIYRLHESELKTGYHVVVVARNRCATSTYAQIERSFLLLCDQLDWSLNPKHPVKFVEASKVQRKPYSSQGKKQQVNNRNKNTNSNQVKPPQRPSNIVPDKT